MLVAEVPRDLVSTTASHLPVPKEPTLVFNEEDKISLTDKDGMESSVLPERSNLNNDKGQEAQSVRIDISFKSPSHTGLQTTELVI